MTSGDLAAAVDRFVDEISAVLDGLTTRSSSFRGVVIDEADALVASVMAADGRVSAEEAEAYARTIGRFVRRNGRPVDAMTARTSDQVLRRRGWESAPSELFSLLVGADQRSGTTHSHRYYHLALECARQAATVDEGVSRDELDVVDQLRTTLLGSIDRAGLARPAAGQPAAPAAARRRRRREREQAKALDQLLDELDGLVGLGTVKASVRQLTNLLQVQQLRRAHELPDPGHQPPPRLQRQPRHGQDHRRPAAGPHLPGPRGGDEGAAGGG